MTSCLSYWRVSPCIYSTANIFVIDLFAGNRIWMWTHVFQRAGDFCNYFLFDRSNGSCLLIQNYKEIIPDSLQKYTECEEIITLEVYRRHRYTGKNFKCLLYRNHYAISIPFAILYYLSIMYLGHLIVIGYSRSTSVSRPDRSPL